MTSRSLRFLGLAALLSPAPALLAEVRPNPLFCDGAVLQRDIAIPVWGASSREGEPVEVTLGDTTVKTVAKDGKWLVRLPARPAGGAPLDLTVKGDNTVVIRDVVLGEVWICSGQSNMERQLGLRGGQQPLVGGEEAIAAADIPGLRLFTVGRSVSGKPLDTVSGKWAHSDPKVAREFSAVGFYFARELKKHLGDVPVGMIHSSWGGTPAESWTSLPALEKLPFMAKPLAGQEKARAAYPKALEDYKKTLAGYPALVEDAKKAGKPVPKKPAPPADPGTNAYSTPGGLRNAMITPLIPYAIKGVIWYQGESNNGRAADYNALFTAMIGDWRKDWAQGDFPFLFVQIAPHRDMKPEIREAQLKTLATAPNTAMAVITDIGDANDIHPTRKQPVGERLALAARALAYGEKIEHAGPLFTGATFSGGKAKVAFAHTGGGLVAGSGADELKGFTLAGADGVFKPAKATIQGAAVVVSSPEVPSPTAVRYGWSNVPDVNLFNKEGLPASPFRSDTK